MYTTKIRVDLYTKIVLTAIAVLLGTLALRPALAPVHAQVEREAPHLYVEPGITTIRKPDGSSLGEGKMVIDLRNGDVWGFPTMMPGSRYPIDVASNQPATSKPILMGRFDFSAMK
jgi:hypothetical protein